MTAAPLLLAVFAANGSAIGGGFAATPDAAGNTKKEGSTSPLSAALVLKATFIESLPKASRPFLTPLAESALREFASHFYAEEKAKETKSDPNYVPSSAKKLGIVLQAMPEVQESQGFKALRNNLTADLEKFRAMITQEYILKANDMNILKPRGQGTMLPSANGFGASPKHSSRSRISTTIMKMSPCWT